MDGMFDVVVRSSTGDSEACSTKKRKLRTEVVLRGVPVRVEVGQLVGGVDDDAAVVGAQDRVVGAEASDVEVVQQMPANEIREQT